MINKSPAFQFYPKDWLSDVNTRCMTLEEKGAYIELMAHEWNESGLPVNDDELAVLSGLGKDWYKGSGEKIKRCFRKRRQKLYHPRLEKERVKQRKWRSECSKGGLKSAQTRRNKRKTGVKGSGKGSCKTVPSKRQVKGNSSFASSSSSSIKDKRLKTFTSDSIEYGLAEWLLLEILARDPGYKKPNLQTWAKDIDRMIRLDKREPKAIGKVIEWCQADDFWQNNILSTVKLRKQYDQLKMKMEGEKKPPAPIKKEPIDDKWLKNV